ncbi:E3 ubiquitin-protein ligase nedd4 [Tritrichomonas musculus]|uniref:E3 ubiquitin-protein ligase nedd4 n=1 Tax=Tritrichomonas musculus TaxID=1915356 RepID=A0ABR2KPK1_9EUKA
MTGTSRVPQNGFNEYDQISSEPLKIVPGGSKSNLPQRRVYFNALFLPEYENEDELNDKLLEAISNSSPFDSD